MWASAMCVRYIRGPSVALWQSNQVPLVGRHTHPIDRAGPRQQATKSLLCGRPYQCTGNC
jgi:hypothetical protein